ncbi:hypothetical protein OROMI_019956 [Orobanche minor]
MTSLFKVVLISTSVLSAAIMLKFSAPAITDLAECVPSIYNGVVSWMTPPYLYLIINCIIITIVASSKLQSMKDGDASLSPAATQPLDVMGIVDPQPMTAPLGVRSIETDYRAADYKYSGVALSDSSDYEVKVERGLELDSHRQQGGGKNEESKVIATGAGGAAASPEDAMSNKENEFVTAKTTWSVPENKYVTATSPSSVKPPVSARFGHRRNLKASPEGAKTGLGVSKSKRLDTLESTWRTITEGRAIPITRHLKKSDTWERDSHLRGRRGHEDKTPEKTMTKAETFNDRTNTRSPSPGSGGGSVKLRREASPSQDELNRRVEAFIKKFNEDMRLQRQESFDQYKEMINRGSH